MKKYIFVIIITFASSLLFNSCKKESVLAEANFTFSGSLDSIPAQIQFTNNSFGISYVWDFGDGTSSNEKNPIHTYNEYGLYKVILTAIGTNNKDTLTKYINIKKQSSLPKVGLIGWWPFNGNANDESGNGNNGSIGTGITLVSDRFGSNNSAYNFNGTGNIRLTYVPTSGSQDFSISGWIKTNNTSLRKGIACWGQDKTWQSTYFFISNNGYLSFDLASAEGPQSPVFIADNSWHFVAVTCNNGIIQLYLNGNTTGTSQQMSPNINGTNKAIGSNIVNSGNLNFIGSIDDIGIWNRALNQQEIKDLYNLK
jgi:PKD repeat protein